MMTSSIAQPRLNILRLIDYELWVTRDKAKSVLRCCDFMFKYLTLGQVIRDVYTSDCDSGHAEKGWTRSLIAEKQDANVAIKG
uniref:Lipocalin n=1 Tax=Rhipicephalus zambeziensis TaxID=60191 RepID=A0A224YCH8_9ACAR